MLQYPLMDDASHVQFGRQNLLPLAILRWYDFFRRFPQAHTSWRAFILIVLLWFLDMSYDTEALFIGYLKILKTVILFSSSLDDLCRLSLRLAHSTTRSHAGRWFRYHVRQSLPHTLQYIKLHHAAAFRWPWLLYNFEYTPFHVFRRYSITFPEEFLQRFIYAGIFRRCRLRKNAYFWWYAHFDTSDLQPLWRINAAYTRWYSHSPRIFHDFRWIGRRLLTTISWALLNISRILHWRVESKMILIDFKQ